MKKEVLTLLGCSGSLALALLHPSAVQANTEAPLREYIYLTPASDAEESIVINNIPGNLADSSQLSNCGCSGAELSEAGMIDGVGDLAITTYGCDCAGCRFLAQELASKAVPQ